MLWRSDSSFPPLIYSRYGRNDTHVSVTWGTDVVTGFRLDLKIGRSFYNTQCSTVEEILECKDKLLGDVEGVD